jgi:broad specificity phosphatase PhoE
MRLLLIRHGQTPANVRGELDTAHPGPRLTALGRAQAARLPAAMQREKIDGIFASTLIRTQLTATPLAQGRSMTVTVLPGLHEIAAGDLEMATDHAAYRAYLGTAHSWISGARDLRMPGAETGHEFFRRFDTDVREIEASGASTAVIVSHGAAIRVWVAGHARNVDPEFPGRRELDNTGLVAVEGSFAAGWSLVEWRGSPLGGQSLADESAEDPTGEPLSEAAV